MASKADLPVVNHPTFKTVLPLSGKTVKFRPFLVKENKILLMALQEKDSLDSQLSAVRQIVDNCTFGVLDLDTIPMVDIEWLILQLRIKSVGEIVELEYVCNNTVKAADDTEKVCGTPLGINLNLSLVEAPKVSPELHSKKIMLVDDIGVVMKYPTLSTVQSLLDSLETVENKEDIITAVANFVDCIFQGDSVTDCSELSLDEVVDWLVELSDEQLGKLESFFETMPTLRYDLKIVCPVCKHEEVITLEGLESFLA